MKQVTQTVYIGVVEINDVPALKLLGKFILVRNSVSLISARTENSKIDTVKISIAKGMLCQVMMIVSLSIGMSLAVELSMSDQQG